MSHIPVTGMGSGEYIRVFGSDPTPIHDDETLIDVGSGLSRLGGVAPFGTIAQLDPVYRESSDDGHCIKIPVEIGANAESKKVVAALAGEDIDRVTRANMLRHLSIEDRAFVISQMLRLSVNGILQLYPISKKKDDNIVGEAERFGFQVISQSPLVRGRRQLVYKAAKINTVLSIVSQPPKVGPSDRLRLARFIAEA